MEFIIVVLLLLYLYHLIVKGFFLPLKRFKLIQEYVVLRDKIFALKCNYGDKVIDPIYDELDSCICKTASRLEHFNYLTVNYETWGASYEEKIKVDNFIESICNCNDEEANQLFDSYLAITKRAFDINMLPWQLYIFPWSIYKAIVKWKKSKVSKPSSDQEYYDEKYITQLKKAMLLFANEKQQHTIILS